MKPVTAGKLLCLLQQLLESLEGYWQLLGGSCKGTSSSPSPMELQDTSGAR